MSEISSAKKEQDKFSDSLIFEGMTSISALLNSPAENDRAIETVWIDSQKRKSKASEIGFLLAKSKDAFSGRTLANAIITLCTKDAALENCDDAVAKAKEYITRHFRENPSLKLCAEFVGLSPNYLAFCFKRQYGLSFKQYLTKCKLSCAKAFLENGASVTKACFDSGFESLSAFYTAFKNQNGLPPSKWKK